MSVSEKKEESGLIGRSGMRVYPKLLNHHTPTRVSGRAYAWTCDLLSHFGPCLTVARAQSGSFLQPHGANIYFHHGGVA